MTVTDLTPLTTNATTEQENKIHSLETTEEPIVAHDAGKSNADDEEQPCCSPLAIATEASSSSSCSSSQAEDNKEISMTQEISMCGGGEEGERKRSVSDKDDLSERTQDDDAVEPEAKKTKSPCSLAVASSDSIADAAGGEEVAEDVVCGSSKTDDAGGHDDGHDALPEQQNCSNEEEEKEEDEEDKKAEDHSATTGVEFDQVDASLEVQHDPAVEEKIDVPEDPHDVATPAVEEVTAA